MLNFTLNEAKSRFFDRKAVMDAVDKAAYKVLSKFGAFVMTRARRSLRPVGKRARARGETTSKPGSPPFSKTGLLKDNIFFVYEPVKWSVLIGPTRLNKPIGDAPHALEYGGPSEAVAWRRGGKAVRTRRIQVRPRPYMQPAFQEEVRRLGPLWRDSIKG